ncbi:MAG: Signal transduction histidine kinase [Rhodobacteraceae bacterium HLUCCA12]|nr:MAG: Signal transduction histidine kinase [Rhodobacteraceae bacterium HLUCCA12]
MPTEKITNETRLTRIQALVVEILNDMLRAPIEDTDASINRAIQRIGAYCKRDRAYVFVNSGELTSNTHEWCAPGIESEIEHLQGLPWSLYGSVSVQLENGIPFHVPDISELPEDDEARKLLESQAIRSVLMVPMRTEGAFYGFMGFDGVHNTHDFLPGELYLLQSVADVICSVLQRRESERAVRAAQAELSGERAFLESILSTSAMGILVLDDSGTIRFANDAAEQILRAPRARIIGKRHDQAEWFRQHEDGKTVEPGATPFAQVLKTKSALADERFLLRVGRATRYCSVHAAPVPEGGSRDARVVYALIDVTEQVLAERAREAALEEARRANAAKTQFLAKMSHEMRTPLNGVLGIAEVLERLVTDADQARMIKVMHDSGTLLLSIINDLLDMSKIEADQLSIEQVPFSVPELAQRIEAVHTLKASEKQLSFAVTVQGDATARRLGDPHRILQILHNVIGNAIKFTETGSVRVELDCLDPEHLVIEVRDTGIGMTQEQQVHVFEEFGQADGSIARKFGGTGLGMPIAKRLVDMMGGTIAFRSQLGAGTTFTIQLPLAKAPSAARDQEREQVIDVQYDLSGLRVLAADDNRTNRMILGAMMGQLGISSVLVSDGPAALEAYDKDEFDAVILDISMPEMDGVKVLKEMRAREARRVMNGKGKAGRRLPILAFTANAMSHQVESYMAAGFDDCLTKPLQIERLRSALGSLIPDCAVASKTAAE